MGLLDRINQGNEQEQSQDVFESYIDSHPNTPAGFLIYDVRPGTRKISEATPWGGASFGHSGDTDPVVAEGRVLVTEMRQDATTGLEAGDIVKFVDQDNPTQPGRVFLIDRRVEKNGKPFLFMRLAMDKQPTKTVVMETRSKRTERSIYAA